VHDLGLSEIISDITNETSNKAMEHHMNVLLILSLESCFSTTLFHYVASAAESWRYPFFS
jgi:hypothetical protein